MRIVQLANFYDPPPAACVPASRRSAAATASMDTSAPRRAGPARRGRQTPPGARVCAGQPSLPGSGDYRVLTATGAGAGHARLLRPDVLEVSDKLSVAWVAPWARRRGVPIVLFSHERSTRSQTRLPGLVPPLPARPTGQPAAAACRQRRWSRRPSRPGSSCGSGRAYPRRVPLGVDLRVSSRRRASWPTGSCGW